MSPWLAIRREAVKLSILVLEHGTRLNRHAPPRDKEIFVLLILHPGRRPARLLHAYFTPATQAPLVLGDARFWVERIDALFAPVQIWQATRDLTVMRPEHAT